ncbi:MAG: hypothetical protein KGL45_03465 [Gammaproteobacteria bacterium]|nr:hypothetical protein [Gammaproteobacteria bacterium]MDE2261561.1 hypothetical protein [Gammaproteobacteria bacterium]
MPAEDSNAFVAELAARHGRRLSRFLAARLRNAADIADLAQEVYLRLLRVERHDQIRNPEAYLLTIAGICSTRDPEACSLRLPSSACRLGFSGRGSCTWLSGPSRERLRW